MLLFSHMCKNESRGEREGERRERKKNIISLYMVLCKAVAQQNTLGDKCN